MSLLISIRSYTVGIAVFFAPETFDDTAIDFGVVCGFYGASRRLLSRKLNKSVTLVFEHPDVLNCPERTERLRYQLLRNCACKSAAVHGAIGRTTLVVNLKITKFFIN